MPEMTPEQYREVDVALLAYWTSRDEARIAQQARGVVEVGGRAGVTSGGHLDRIAQVLARVCRAAGAPASAIYYKAPVGDPNRRESAAPGFTLPGWFRPTKQWDLVVHHGSGSERQPIVVIELKSQNGPSYGNNANNRAEEAIGNALDLQRAIREHLVPGHPWTGYVFVIEDDPASRLIRGANERGFYSREPLLGTWSYISRVRHLSERLVAEHLYDAAWAIASSRPMCPSPNDLSKCPLARSEKPHEHEFGWTELDPPVSGYAVFVESLIAQIRKYYPGESDPLTLDS